MKRTAFFLLLFCSWGFSEDYNFNYTQYMSCKYKANLEKYCDGEEPIWKSGSIRVNLTNDSLLFVFLNKKTTYRIELNTIRSDYNEDGDEVLVFTGRSGSHNYMFVAGPDFFNFLEVRNWGMYFSNSESRRKSLSESDFGLRKFPILSTALCYYSGKTDRYDSACTYYNYDEPRDFLLKTAYRNKKLYLYVDSVYTLDISEVENAKNSDSVKILLYYGKDRDGNKGSVAIGPDYFNLIFSQVFKLSLMREKLPDDLVRSSTRENSWSSGSSVAIAPNILITNAHVTKNMSRMELYLDGKTVPNNGYEIVGEFWIMFWICPSSGLREQS